MDWDGQNSEARKMKFNAAWVAVNGLHAYNNGRKVGWGAIQTKRTYTHFYLKTMKVLIE